MRSRYLLRFDDICPTMNWVIWERIESLLVDHGIKPIVAVVPENRDPGLAVSEPIHDFWAKVREWQGRGWSIALHGHTHEYVTNKSGLVGINPYSEFAGLPIDKQRKKLAQAVSRFEEEQVRLDAWVAPAHSFDRNTMIALGELGIRVVSDGFTWRPRKRFRMLWIPQQLWRFRDMPFGIWTVCMHPNGMGEQEIKDLESSLNLYKGRITSLIDLTSKRTSVVGRWSPVDSLFAFFWRRALQVRRNWA